MTVSEQPHVAILVSDTPIDGITEKFGDFGDNTHVLLTGAGCTTPIIKYQVAFESGTDYSQELAQVYQVLEANWKSGLIKAVVVTGSRSDSFATDVPWITRLDEFLRAYALNPQNETVPMAGICFGHQIIAKNLGCKVDRNSIEESYESGVTTVDLNTEIFEIEDSPFVETLVDEEKNIFNHLNLVQFHRDIVYDLPPPKVCADLDTSFIGLGSTSKCAIQGLITEKGKIKILTFQGHPEFTTPETLDLLGVDYKINLIDKNQYEKSMYASKSLNNQGDLVGRAIAKFFQIHET